MAKSAAALHILVKEEKLAHEILAKLERGHQLRSSGEALLKVSVRTSWR